MKRTLLRVLAASGVLVVTSALAPSAFAADQAPTTTNNGTTYRTKTLKAVSIGAAWVDYPHISRTNKNVRSMNVHGGWIKGNTPAKTANITLGIQIKRGSSWVTIKQRTEYDKLPGTGSTVRSNIGGVPCVNSTWNTYRGWADADLNGVFDTPGKVYSDPIPLDCGV